MREIEEWLLELSPSSMPQRSRFNYRALGGDHSSRSTCPPTVDHESTWVDSGYQVAKEARLITMQELDIVKPEGLTTLVGFVKPLLHISATL